MPTLNPGPLALNFAGTHNQANTPDQAAPCILEATERCVRPANGIQLHISTLNHLPCQVEPEGPVCILHSLALQQQLVALCC